MTTAERSFVEIVLDDGIAAITIKNPPVNALSPGVPEAIVSAIHWINQNVAVDAAVIAGSGNCFVAGADINEFVKMTSGLRAPGNLQPFLQAVEDSEKPVVAAIHGFALGGGIELAMSCHYRVALESARVGQPEVLLGIIPGAAGTQRLPRLVGIAKALEMCTTGKPISARDAMAVGLLDRVFKDDLLPQSIQFAREIASKPIKKSRNLSAKVSRSADNAAAIEKARETVEKNQRGLLAPVAAIESIANSLSLSFQEACRQERKIFERCLYSDQSKALVHVFLAEREAARVSGGTEQQRTRPFARIGVLTSDLLPASIVTNLAEAGFKILPSDASTDAAVDVLLGPNPQALAEAAEQQQNHGVERQLPLILCTFSSRNPQIQTDRSTSWTLPQGMARLHFLDGSKHSRAVEVSAGTNIDLMTVAECVRIVKKLGKVPVVFGNCTGSVGDGTFIGYLDEITSIVNEGTTADEVAGVLRDFGMAIDPFELPHRISPQAADTAPNNPQSRRSDQQSTISHEEIIQRCLFRIVNASCVLLDQKCARSPGDIDTIWINSFGFPAHLGGPMWYADALGLQTLVEIGRGWRAKNADQHQISTLLQDCAKYGRKLSDFRTELHARATSSKISNSGTRCR
jgi:3-hydroxyacyl-CoA dehydrogenase